MRPLRHRVAQLLLVPVTVVGLLGAVGCGSSDPAPPPDRVDTDAAGDADSAGAVAGPPSCPFTAEQVSTIVGQPMVGEGSCLFSDGKGVASLTVETASKIAGSGTFTYKRDQAAQRYDQVDDLDQGDMAYVAVKDIEGEAVLVDSTGAYTLIMSSFTRLDPAGYGQTLRRLLDAIGG
ncbi:hypothetical protein [Micromonospora endolithica]|uniref:DUF3558 domain-containing protein n=1 Tax=Micromonospora endolithica TaxID=230091 RepID=A0A3A9ZRN6_9ACTN|nr:hypothetical protein [Micromonospora endolithica]RKN50875.1 hypothetical protein D7223_03770 [Micromonospora endolithica]TWJ20356.1 hypothetical protein JD76_00454 [Micromonospora endolithica]